MLAHVASSSSTDLFRAKLCCKLFYEVSEADNIYQRVSLDKFEIVPWQKNDKVSRFLKKCREKQKSRSLVSKRSGKHRADLPLLEYSAFSFEVGNEQFSHVQYNSWLTLRQVGLLWNVDYFTDKHEDSALECVEEAANSGHADAAYALGIIYIFVGGDELKRKGMRLLSGMKKSKILKGRVKLCRDKLRALLRMIWVKNPVFLNPTPICCAVTHERKTSSWPMDADDVEESTCEGCACDEEIGAICAALPYR
ncbi:uncharacterized protein [Coffea arabica]|uniref:At2g35280-like TPR domain-containing protein n=1 Tax=Coffea arabica TaxID=13443 RepID=A0ABM4V9T6_COFAR